MNENREDIGLQCVCQSVLKGGLVRRCGSMSYILLFTSVVRYCSLDEETTQITGCDDRDPIVDNVEKIVAEATLNSNVAPGGNQLNILTFWYTQKYCHSF